MLGQQPAEPEPDAARDLRHAAVRIHAIGMPNGGSSPSHINSRFSVLMRAMCDDNEGTFVGLTVGGPGGIRIKVNDGEIVY